MLYISGRQVVKQSNGAPGIDGVTFEAIEKGKLQKETGYESTDSVDCYLSEIQKELKEGTYRPSPYRKQEIPKGNGKWRTLSIPTIKDRIVQTTVKLILEPIFEADFQDGSYGYRPGRKPADAVKWVSIAILLNKTKVLDLDISSFFDNVRHPILFKQVGRRTNDPAIFRLLKQILKANGRKGIPQGSPLSPLLANLYLNDIDKLFERVKEEYKTEAKNGLVYSGIEYARFADDMVVLVNKYWQQNRIEEFKQRIVSELQNVGLTLNEEKTKLVDLEQNQTFAFLGFDFRRIKGMRGKWFPLNTPRMRARTALIRKLKDIFKRYASQPVQRVINLINPILRGWVNYFRTGNSRRTFRYIQTWVLKKVRRHMMRARNRGGYGWNRWSSDWIYQTCNLFKEYYVRYV